MIQYRNPEIKDIHPIINLELECMEELKTTIGAEFPLFDKSWNNEVSLLSIIEGGAGVSVIAADDDYTGANKIIGAIIALDDEYEENGEYKTLTIMNIFVNKEYRKLGIGHHLLEMAEEWAKENRYIEIQTKVYTPNDEAISLLDSANIRPIAQYRLKILDNEKYLSEKDEEFIQYYEDQFARAKRQRTR